MSIFKQGDGVIESEMNPDIFNEASRYARKLSQDSEATSISFNVKGAQICVTRDPSEIIGDTQVVVENEIFFIGYEIKKKKG